MSLLPMVVSQNLTPNDITRGLAKLGLKNRHTSAWTTLIQAKTPVTADNVARRAGIPQPKIYKVLDELQEVGVITCTPEGVRPRKYWSLPYKESLLQLRRIKENEIATAERDAFAYFETLATPELDMRGEMDTYVGAEHCVAGLRSVIETGKPWLALLDDQLQKEMMPDMLALSSSLLAECKLISLASNLQTEMTTIFSEAQIAVIDDRQIPVPALKLHPCAVVTPGFAALRLYSTKYDYLGVRTTNQGLLNLYNAIFPTLWKVIKVAQTNPELRRIFATEIVPSLFILKDI